MIRSTCRGSYTTDRRTTAVTWESRVSCRLLQFHLRARNWYWHSSMARTAPSRTESMKPGFRLQNFTWAGG